MVGAVLAQNTAWSNVARAITQLKKNNMLDAQYIIAADHNVIAELIRPAGYFNIKTRRLKNFCDWYQSSGGMPALMKLETSELRVALLKVNGIGPETADDMLLYAFDRPVFVVDAYTHRVFSRLGVEQAEQDYETLRGFFEHELPEELIAELAVTTSSVQIRRASPRRLIKIYNEYHALIVRLGSLVCRPKPRCDECCLKQHCGYFKQVFKP